MGVRVTQRERRNNFLLNMLLTAPHTEISKHPRRFIMPRKLNPIEQRTFRAARYAALRSLQYTIAQLRNGHAGVAQRWMALDHPEDLNFLADGLQRIFDALQAIHQDQIFCEPGVNWYAEVNPNQTPHAITLGERFFTTPTYGTDSRAGTLIHETSHFRNVLRTNDHAYGVEECLELVEQAEESDDNLRKVINNADNWEYLVEHSY